MSMYSYFIRFLRKTIRFITISFVVIGVFITIISAFIQLTKSDKEPLLVMQNQAKSPYQAIYDEIDASSKSVADKKKAKELMMKTACSLTGKDCKNPDDSNNSFISAISSLVTLPYTRPPASGVSYAMYKLENNNFLPSTYAYEGVGLSSIRGYVKVWEVFRNFAYLLLVLMVVILGFLIMFRTQLDGQTVVSIQNALPRVVITLILITLSFPIAGFMIDIMYACIGLFVFLISSAFGSFQTPLGFNEQMDLVNKYLGAGLRDLWPHKGVSSAWATGSGLYNVLPEIFKIGLNGVIGPLIEVIVVKLYLWKIKDLLNMLSGVAGQGFTFGGSWGNLTQSPYWILSLIVSSIVSYFFYGAQLVITVLILFTLLLFCFRIFFMLLSAYIKLVLLIIFSPIILLFQVLPGRNAFGWWFKMMIGELLTFVAVVAITITGAVIVGVNQNSDMAFKLPFLHAGFAAEDFGAIIGLGLVLMIPDLIRLFKGILGIQELGINFGAGMFFSGVTDAFGGVQQGLHSYSSIAHVPMMQKFLPSALTKRIAPKTVGQMMQDVMEQTSIWKGPQAGKDH